MKNRLKKFFFSVLLMFITLFLMGLTGEALIRLLYADEMVLFPRYHTDYQYGGVVLRGIRPDSEFIHRSPDGVFHFRTNNRGFRNDHDIAYTKPAGVIRVLCLGDSHTQGYEVDQEETFAYQTQQLLNANGIKAEVINAGVSGYSNAEELLFLMHEGYKYQPDYVVLGFYANDLIDNLKSGLFKLKGDTLIQVKNAYIPGVKIQNSLYRFRVFRYLGEHSYLYAFLFNSIWNMAKKALAKKSKEAVVTEYAIPVGEVNSYQVQLATAIIKEMYRFCRKINARFIILDIPLLSLKPSVPQEAYPEFRANCDMLFYTNDLLPVMKALKETHRPSGHHHISPEMHALYARKISGYIIHDIQSRQKAGGDYMHE